MSKILAVARWEYLEKVKSKTFLVGLLITPILMIGMGILPSYFAGKEDEVTRVIGLIDESGSVARQFSERMMDQYRLANGNPAYVVQVLAIGPGLDLRRETEEASRLVAAESIIGFCVVGSGVDRDSVVEYRSTSVGDFRITGRIEKTLRDIVAERRIVALGLDPKVLKELKVSLQVDAVKISKTGEAEHGGFETVFLSAYVFMMTLFLLIVTSGQMLVRSVIEEKSNRIVEILVSSCSPTELMAGKVLGLSGLGFTQMAFWALIGTGVALQFGVSVIDPGHAALMVVYFILGYLFYAAVFIGAGSPLNTEQEAQQITSYLVIVLMIPLVMALPAMKTPDALWIKVLTYIPFLTPTMMALRIPIQVPSLLEILTSIGLMLVSIYFAMVAAGRIFRIGILLTGKSPKLAEILRWVRTG
jgi:ABC-2 type transport system permease protein